MRSAAIGTDADVDVFDLDYQELPGGDIGRPPMRLGPSGTCWPDSCGQCCAASDWRTGC